MEHFFRGGTLAQINNAISQRPVISENMSEKQTIQTYLDLIRAFTGGDMSATEFSMEYIEEFKNEEELPSDELFS